MKRTKKMHTYPAYPNAAENSYFLHKLIDALTAVASAAGLSAAMIFLVYFL